ncbi:hypothetical protein BDA99DRAFT_521620 [Phascolomyces articulosus]|uniref:HTH APSES-type domain-containing protein n=1 Tax=Phascolomyces articulosus TaxID=60185 RepID=A0AAD5JRK0_9FUNG|nr:hypothetical protein BDA99DRAFT_521620 [Phascolomyces articulosus]
MQDYTTEVYRAMYSGIAVYEMLIRGMPLMRRRKDSYMNSTQILKVAGYDKGKRTRIVEREILPGVHEKIQGGYGKFQGTWIPMEIGKSLAEKYGVFEVARPLFELDLSKYDNDHSRVPTKEEALAHYDPQHTSSPPPSPLSSVITAPSPMGSSIAASSPRPYNYNNQHQHHSNHHPSPNNYNNNSRRRSIDERSITSTSTTAAAATATAGPRKKMRAIDEEKHRSQLMGLFVSSDDSPQVPELLKPPDIDINLVIDDQGHTALHWAASLARIKTLELLLVRGADVCRVNHAGETALMRGVMLTHSFDTQCFPKLLEHLKESIPVMDRRRRTVIHHTALTAAIHGRHNAALFYMKHILSTIGSTRHLQSVIHAEDINGDTGLSIAMRLGLQSMVTMLNEFSSITRNITESKQPLDTPTPDIVKKTYKPSTRGREIVSTVQKIVDAIDDDYHSQLRERDERLESMQVQLRTVMFELNEARQKLSTHQIKNGYQSAESNEFIRKLENTRDSNNNNVNPKRQRIEQQPSVTTAYHHEKEKNEDENDLAKKHERWLEERVQLLQVQVEAHARIQHELNAQIEQLKRRSSEKEMQCKRLIAACCNMTIDEIDGLLEPLLASVESNPPDLDLPQVIQFMERLSQQEQDNVNNKGS